MLCLVTSSTRKVPLPYSVHANIYWIFGQPVVSVQRRQSEKCIQQGYYRVMSRLLPDFLYCHCIETIGVTRKRLTLWDFISTTTFRGIKRNLYITFCSQLFKNKQWLFFLYYLSNHLQKLDF